MTTRPIQDMHIEIPSFKMLNEKIENAFLNVEVDTIENLVREHMKSFVAEASETFAKIESYDDDTRSYPHICQLKSKLEKARAFEEYCEDLAELSNRVDAFAEKLRKVVLTEKRELGKLVAISETGRNIDAFTVNAANLSAGGSAREFVLDYAIDAAFEQLQTQQLHPRLKIQIWQLYAKSREKVASEIRDVSKHFTREKLKKLQNAHFLSAEYQEKVREYLNIIEDARQVEQKEALKDEICKELERINGNVKKDLKTIRERTSLLCGLKLPDVLLFFEQMFEGENLEELVKFMYPHEKLRKHIIEAVCREESTPEAKTRYLGALLRIITVYHKKPLETTIQEGLKHVKLPSWNIGEFDGVYEPLMASYKRIMENSRLYMDVRAHEFLFHLIDPTGIRRAQRVLHHGEHTPFQKCLELGRIEGLLGQALGELSENDLLKKTWPMKAVYMDFANEKFADMHQPLKVDQVNWSKKMGTKTIDAHAWFFYRLSLEVFLEIRSEDFAPGGCNRGARVAEQILSFIKAQIVAESDEKKKGVILNNWIAITKRTTELGNHFLGCHLSASCTSLSVGNRYVDKTKLGEIEEIYCPVARSANLQKIAKEFKPIQTLLIPHIGLVLNGLDQAQDTENQGKVKRLINQVLLPQYGMRLFHGKLPEGFGEIPELKEKILAIEV